MFNDPFALRIIGIIAVIGGITIATNDWPAPWRWWQLPLLFFLSGIGCFIRSFLIELGYADKD